MKAIRDELAGEEVPFAVQSYEARRGFLVAIATVTLTVVTFAIAVLTPPLSGPLCESGCFEHPYAEIAGRFPRDYYWMFPAIVLSVALVVLFACVHRSTPERMAAYSLAALALGTAAAAILLLDYYVQLAVVQPSVLRGERDGIALLSQFNPHGVFIAMEEAGYSLLAVALVCLSPVFWRAGRIGRAIAWTFIVSAILAVVSLVAIGLQYGIEREYRFEIAIITIDWLAVIIGGALIAALFAKSRSSSGRRTRDPAG